MDPKIMHSDPALGKTQAAAVQVALSNFGGFCCPGRRAAESIHISADFFAHIFLRHRFLRAGLTGRMCAAAISACFSHFLSRPPASVHDGASPSEACGRCLLIPVRDGRIVAVAVCQHGGQCNADSADIPRHGNAGSNTGADKCSVHRRYQPNPKQCGFRSTLIHHFSFLSFCFYCDLIMGHNFFCPPSSTAGNFSPAHRPSMQQTGSSTYSTCLPVRAEKEVTMKISFANSHDSILPHYKLQKHAKTCSL